MKSKKRNDALAQVERDLAYEKKRKASLKLWLVELRVAKGVRDIKTHRALVRSIDAVTAIDDLVNSREWDGEIGSREAIRLHHKGIPGLVCAAWIAS